MCNFLSSKSNYFAKEEIKIGERDFLAHRWPGFNLQHAKEFPRHWQESPLSSNGCRKKEEDKGKEMELKEEQEPDWPLASETTAEHKAGCRAGGHRAPHN